MNTGVGNGDKLSLITSTQPCRRFSIAEIQSATNDFDDELVIGKGGFGKVYKGHIVIEESSHVVAIKRLDSMSNQGESEFRAEIEMLSKLHHCHLVSLIGFCHDDKEMILVYEYMPNGALYDHLHKKDTHFTWVQRLKIAIGAGRGLDYLHTGVGTKQGIIQRDVKSSNILLDENWDAMISDFGLSKISPTNQSSSYVDASVKGTFGYLDPEYFYTRKLTRKTDVYAYGVVLFELLTGRRAVDKRNGEEQCSLAWWAQKCVKERKLEQMVDSSIAGTISPKCLRGFAEIADRCLTSVLEKRPTMTELVAKLHALLEVQESSSVRGFPWKIPSIFLLQRNRTLWDFESYTCLGERSYGKVYKGWIDKTTGSPCKHNTGLPIAVKRLYHYKYFDPEMLKEFRHANLVKLIRYCLEGEQLFLVHVFMHKGNLKDLLCGGSVLVAPSSAEKSQRFCSCTCRELCFNICNEVDSESKMLTSLEYEKYILAGHENELERNRFRVGYTLKGHVERMIAFKETDFDQIQALIVQPKFQKLNGLGTASHKK